MSALCAVLCASAAASAAACCAVACSVEPLPVARRDPVGEAAARLLSLAAVEEARGAASRARRRAECLGQLPVMIDVVTLGLSAGLSFDSSLELYCERYDDALSEALAQALLSWRIGARTRGEALEAAASELGLPELSRFSSVVCEALSFGSPMAESLGRQAQLIRDERRSQVEEEIERVPVKMLIPLGTLIVPAMLLAILGPLLGSALVLG